MFNSPGANFQPILIRIFTKVEHKKLDVVCRGETSFQYRFVPSWHLTNT